MVAAVVITGVVPLVVATTTTTSGWLSGTAVEHRSLVGGLSLSCARPVAEG